MTNSDEFVLMLLLVVILLSASVIVFVLLRDWLAFLVDPVHEAALPRVRALAVISATPVLFSLVG